MTSSVLSTSDRAIVVSMLSFNVTKCDSEANLGLRSVTCCIHHYSLALRDLLRVGLKNCVENQTAEKGLHVVITNRLYWGRSAEWAGRRSCSSITALLFASRCRPFPRGYEPQFLVCALDFGILASQHQTGPRAGWWTLSSCSASACRVRWRSTAPDAQKRH